MILAAGYGSRLRPHSNLVPKPAIPFLNIPLIYYGLSLLKPDELDALVVNTHHLPKQITGVLESIPHLHEKLLISHEPTEPLGSGGGIFFARSLLQGRGSFSVINGDEVIFPANPRLPEGLRKYHEQQNALATLLVMRNPKVGTQFGGVWADAAGNVHGFGKTSPRSDLEGFHFTGVQVLSERIFEYRSAGPSNIFYDVLTRGIGAGEKISIFIGDLTWYETGNVADFLSATGLCLNEIANRREHPWLRHMMISYWPRFGERKSIWEGVHCHHSLSDLAKGPILLGNDVTIDPSVRISGFAVIGDRAQIGADCELRNCVIGPGAKLPAESRVEHDLYLGGSGSSPQK